MDTHRQSGAGTLAPSSSEAARSHDEHRPPAGRASPARAATRWFLVVPFVLIAPIALIAWTAMPRVTSPALVAEEAVEIGLTQSARTALVDGFATQLAERRDAPLVEDTMREVFDRSLTQEWFDEQVFNIAGELDRWLLGSGDQLPDLVIDLVLVKTALASDPEAMQLVANFVGCEGIECAPENQTVEVALVGVPDQAALLNADADSSEAEGLIKARGLLQTGRRMSAIAPLILLGELALLALLARRHGRLRFTGGVLIVVGALVLLIAWLGPGWVGGEVAGSIPDDAQVAAVEIAALVWWMLEPARTLAYWVVAAGAIAYVGSFAWTAMSRQPI